MTEKTIELIKLLVILVLSVFAFRILASIFSSSLQFDESYNLQIPLNLYLNGSYQTWYNEFKQFNPWITTGPTVLLPIYFLFSVFSSTSHILARLVVYSFFLLLIWLCYREFFQKDPTSIKILFGITLFILIFSVPRTGVVSTYVLGEIPGIALLILSFCFFDSETSCRQFFSGLFLALATLAKLIFIMSLVPFAGIVLLDLTLKKRLQQQTKKLCLFFLGIIIPITAWQTYKLNISGM